MSERIYTIPINEAFERREGCPLCHLHNKLEENTLNYSLGAAMMEPDVRIEMNKLGFCHTHLSAMSGMKNKLALALILESLIDEQKKHFENTVTGKKARKNVDSCESLNEFCSHCFVCEKIRFTETRYLSNTISLWEEDSAFRDKFANQSFFCVTHTAGLLKFAKNDLKAAKYPEFYGIIMNIESNYFSGIKDGISKFCASFDHRNAGLPMGDEKFSIEQAVILLK